jgi:hypothetical protein
MKIAQRTKYATAAFLFVVATIGLSFGNVKFASAAPVTWTGEGDGTSFSDGDNWSSGAAPVNGDALTFSVTSLTQQATVNNDISNLSVAGITFSGTRGGSDYSGYTIQGNPFTLTGNVQNTISGANADYVVPTIQNNLVLGANVTATKVNLGTTGSTINLQSHNLSFTGAASCGTQLDSALSGTGALNISGDRVIVSGTSTSFAGPINVTAGSTSIGIAALGTSAGATTVSGSGKLGVVVGQNTSSAEPFTLGGTGSFGAIKEYVTGCSGGGGSAATLTLTGGVTLTSNFIYDGNNNTIINDPYTDNGHTFTVGGGVAGTLTTPQGEVTAPEETIQLDGDSTAFVSLGGGQTGVLNGTRNVIGVNDGGVLKGTGTANTISVNQGGTINPGNSPGKLTVLESLTIAGTYVAEIQNTNAYDKLAVGANYTGGSNAVALISGSVLTPVLYSGWSVKQGDKFTIIDNQSSTAVSGTFEGLTEGAQIAIGGVTFSISYVGGDGNDVVLTALNTGNDPSAPNTGALQMITKSPFVVAGFGIAAAALLIALATRRRQTNK